MDLDQLANGEVTLLSVDDISGRLGVSRTTFDRWVKRGYFPKADVKIGVRAKWDIESLKTWIRKQMTSTPCHE